MVCHSLCRDGLAADKLQSHLRQRVGLAEHGHGALSKDLLAREFGHFRGDVHVADARFGGLQVFSLDVQVGNGVLKAILHGAKVRANLVLGDDGLVQGFKGFLGLSLRGDGVTGAGLERTVGSAVEGRIADTEGGGGGVADDDVVVVFRRVVGRTEVDLQGADAAA